MISIGSLRGTNTGAIWNAIRQTLEQLLEYGDMRALIMESLAFVPLNTTVADAKRTMEQTEDCQDVFITQTGSKTEQVLGWFTNVDISNRMEWR